MKDDVYLGDELLFCNDNNNSVFFFSFLRAPHPSGRRFLFGIKINIQLVWFDVRSFCKNRKDVVRSVDSTCGNVSISVRFMSDMDSVDMIRLIQDR